MIDGPGLYTYDPPYGTDIPDRDRRPLLVLRIKERFSRSVVADIVMGGDTVVDTVNLTTTWWRKIT